MPYTAYYNLKNTFREGVKKPDNLKKIYKIFDDIAILCVRVIMAQFKKRDLTEMMCKFLFTKQAATSGVIAKSFELLNTMRTKHPKKTIPDIPKMVLFFIYHSTLHKLNPLWTQNEKVHNPKNLFYQYTKQFKITVPTLTTHPLLSLLNIKYGDPYISELMTIAGKTFTPYSFFRWGGGKHTRAYRHGSANKTRKYPTS
jgi:hypothetical protein